MDNKTKFKHACVVMQDHYEFKKECDKHDFDDDERLFIIASALDKEYTNAQKCELVGIKFNHRAYRRYKNNRDEGKHDHAEYLTALSLTPDTKTDAKEQLSTLEHIEQLISSKPNDNVLLNALKLREETIDKASGSSSLKPWERLWNDVIIPNMVHTQ